MVPLQFHILELVKISEDIRNSADLLFTSNLNWPKKAFCEMKDNPRILLPALPAPFYEIGTMLEFWVLFLPINVGHLGLKVSKYQDF